jgi:hypothetical protein
VPRCFSLRLVPHHRNPAFALFMTTFSRPPSCIMFSKSAVGCPAPVWHEDRDHRHRSQGTPKPPASATSSGDQSFTCPSPSLPSRHHIAYYFMMIHSRFFFCARKTMLHEKKSVHHPRDHDPASNDDTVLCDEHSSWTWLGNVLCKHRGVCWVIFRKQGIHWVSQVVT